jgi:hypothetical protein
LRQIAPPESHATALAGSRDALKPEHVVEAARAGDAFALAELARWNHYVARGIVWIAMGLAPQAVVLGTIAVAAGETLALQPIRDQVRARVWPFLAERLQILPAALGSTLPYRAALASRSKDCERAQRSGCQRRWRASSKPPAGTKPSVAASSVASLRSSDQRVQTPADTPWSCGSRRGCATPCRQTDRSRVRARRYSPGRRRIISVIDAMLSHEAACSGVSSVSGTWRQSSSAASALRSRFAARRCSPSAPTSAAPSRTCAAAASATCAELRVCSVAAREISATRALAS